MGIVTGTTQHKLDLVKSYDPNNPYIIGLNGVIAINYDGNGYAPINIKSVEYVLNGVWYKTEMTSNSNNLVPNLNTKYSGNKSYIPQTQRNIIQKDTVLPTVFRYVTQPLVEDDYFVFKDEVKMGVVFSPKVSDEVFIERQSITIFEKQSRLSEIKTLDDLEEYNNGFYKIVNLQ